MTWTAPCETPGYYMYQWEASVAVYNDVSRLSHAAFLKMKKRGAICSRINIPKDVMSYPDFPFKKGGRSYASHQEVRDYLKTYAQHFDLFRYIQVCAATDPSESGPVHKLRELLFMFVSCQPCML